MIDLAAKLPEPVMITAEMKRRAWDFAKAVVSTVNYSDHNQSNAGKVMQDHYVSKLGEEAVYRVCLKHGLRVDKSPDYAIYEGKAKSWESDLVVCGEKVAVKTQRKAMADRYGLSWTFASGGLRSDPILAQPAYTVAFVEYFERPLNLCFVMAFRRIGELTFAPPALEKLKDVKKVVYYKGL